MKKVSILLVVILTFAVLSVYAGGGRQSSGDTITLKIAHTGSELTMVHKTVLHFKELVEKNSNGRFKVDIYHSTMLGNDAQLVEATQSGDLQMMFTNTGNLLSFVPELGVFALPFAFPSHEVAYKVLDGSFGKEMLDIMEKKGSMVGISYLEAVAYRELSTKNKVVRVPGDMAGIKIRVMTNPIHIEIWKSMGAQPTPISFAELYTALQQGTIDAQENPLELFISQRFYEVQKQITLTHHVFTTGMLMANPAWFNGLPANLQKVIRDAGMEATLLQRRLAAEDYDGYLKTLAANNVTVTTLNEADFKQWQDKAAPVRNMIANEVGGMALVDKLLNAVKDAQR